ncbi:hypothetical protein LENED_001992 [Lentinula edodes]|uniref:DUF6533 domain-containing protein n=1 Tax=Lentinula edodes TaxID=5353 RepID=A0A1Q3E0E0_LENED|nr:hypothetical protein LENED_001992 [Lentinula edodes]
MGDVISDDRTWMVANYVVVAGSTLWIAEFIETLPTEIDSIWVNRKITGTSMLFLMNRYMFLLGLIFQALRVLPGNGTNKECQVIDGLYSLLQCVTSAITNILFALRIYAIYNKNRFVLISSLTMIFFIFIFEVLIEALEPGISTVGSPFQIFSRCKTNPKGELPLKSTFNSTRSTIRCRWSILQRIFQPAYKPPHAQLADIHDVDHHNISRGSKYWPVLIITLRPTNVRE